MATHGTPMHQGEIDDFEDEIDSPKGQGTYNDFNPTPENLNRRITNLKDIAQLSDMEFGDEEDDEDINADLREKKQRYGHSALEPGDYSTQVAKPGLNLLAKDDEEDGLPNILEESCAEKEQDNTFEALEIIKVNTQIKSRGTIDLGKGYMTNAMMPRNSDMTGNSNL